MISKTPIRRGPSISDSRVNSDRRDEGRSIFGAPFSFLPIGPIYSGDHGTQVSAQCLKGWNIGKLGVVFDQSMRYLPRVGYTFVILPANLKRTRPIDRRYRMPIP
jgi:hypothetical protein